MSVQRAIGGDTEALGGWAQLLRPRPFEEATFPSACCHSAPVPRHFSFIRKNMSLPRLSRLVLPVVLGTSLLCAGCAAPIALTVVSYGADGVSLAGTGKTATDHLISMVSTKDCAMWRILRGQKICNDRVGDQDPYQVNYSEPYRS